MASRPLMASCPAILLAKSALSASESPANALRRSNMVCRNGFTVPSVFLMDTPSAFRAFAASAGGADMRTKIERREVPASLALMPEFAIRPIARPTSSTEYLSAPAIGATYLNVSPMSPTFVFELVAAFARTSAKCAESSACRPNAESASVTISDTRPRSSPDAAARFMIPGRPASI